MALDMRVNDSKISSKDMVLKCGLMELSMRDNIWTAKKKGRVSSPEKTVQFTLAPSRKI